MKKKQSIVTFKVNEDLLAVIRDIPNRSEFIRAAIMAALENVCPLCSGSGILTPKQKEHWESFSRDHTLKRCDDCQEIFIECTR
ncbi:MAG TPA: ribbon-helix-helix domain-containing protein [Syntrophorhabdaceae bacterium]|nr:ribbon-helix-helix domain-containing protein [Syntrophorhabdaceae bacterium]